MLYLNTFVSIILYDDLTKRIKKKRKKKLSAYTKHKIKNIYLFVC